MLDPTAISQVPFTDAVPSPYHYHLLHPSPRRPALEEQHLHRALPARPHHPGQRWGRPVRSSRAGLQLEPPRPAPCRSPIFRAFGTKIVNELRFQYLRTRARQTPISNAPALVVQGGFTGGGNNTGLFNDNQDAYEIQNYASFDLGRHFLRAGVRQRLLRDPTAPPPTTTANTSSPPSAPIS